MIESRAGKAVTLRFMAGVTLLCRDEVARILAGRNGPVMASNTIDGRVRCRQCSEATVIHRRQGKTPAGRVTVATALARGVRMNRDKRGGVGRVSQGRAGDVQRDRRVRGIDETPRMRPVMAIRALDTGAGHGGTGVVDKPAHKGRGVMAIATVRRGGRVDMTRNLPRRIQSIMAGGTRDGVACQHAMIEHPTQVVTGGVVAEITGGTDIPCGGMRVGRGVLPGNRHAI